MKEFTSISTNGLPYMEYFAEKWFESTYFFFLNFSFKKYEKTTKKDTNYEHL